MLSKFDRERESATAADSSAFVEPNSTGRFNCRGGLDGGNKTTLTDFFPTAPFEVVVLFDCEMMSFLCSVSDCPSSRERDVTNRVLSVPLAIMATTSMAFGSTSLSTLLVCGESGAEALELEDCVASCSVGQEDEELGIQQNKNDLEEITAGNAKASNCVLWGKVQRERSRESKLRVDGTQ